MESKVCSRSQGHPPGARNLAMMKTARSNLSPVVGIAPNLNQRGRDGKNCRIAEVRNCRLEIVWKAWKGQLASRRYAKSPKITNRKSLNHQITTSQIVKSPNRKSPNVSLELAHRLSDGGDVVEITQVG